MLTIRDVETNESWDDEYFDCDRRPEYLEDRLEAEARAEAKAIARRQRLGNPPALVPGSHVARVLLAVWTGGKTWHRLDSLVDLATVITHLSVRAHAGGRVFVLGHRPLGDLGTELRACGMDCTWEAGDFRATWGHGWAVYDPDDDPDLRWEDGYDPQSDPDRDIIPGTDEWEFASCGGIVAKDKILVHGPANGLGNPPIDVVLAAQ